MTEPDLQWPSTAEEKFACATPSPAGPRFHALIAEFFRDLPAARLCPLLSHSRPEIILGALFIADTPGPRAAGILQAVAPLASHPDPAIRFHAIEVIGNRAPPGHEGPFIHVATALDDPHPQCRRLAMLLLARASASRLEAAVNACRADPSLSTFNAGLQMLLAGPSRSEINTWLNHFRALNRRFGAVATARMGPDGESRLAAAAAHADEEIRAFAQAQLALLEAPSAPFPRPFASPTLAF